jgi:hypothetical protein
MAGVCHIQFIKGHLKLQLISITWYVTKMKLLLYILRSTTTTEFNQNSFHDSTVILTYHVCGISEEKVATASEGFAASVC